MHCSLQVLELRGTFCFCYRSQLHTLFNAIVFNTLRQGLADNPLKITHASTYVTQEQDP